MATVKKQNSKTKPAAVSDKAKTTSNSKTKPLAKELQKKANHATCKSNKKTQHPNPIKATSPKQATNINKKSSFVANKKTTNQPKLEQYYSKRKELKNKNRNAKVETKQKLDSKKRLPRFSDIKKIYSFASEAYGRTNAAIKGYDYDNQQAAIGVIKDGTKHWYNSVGGVSGIGKTWAETVRMQNPNTVNAQQLLLKKAGITKSNN